LKLLLGLLFCIVISCYGEEQLFFMLLISDGWYVLLHNSVIMVLQWHHFLM